MADLTILPFDLKGVLSSNLRTGEEHTLTSVPGKTNRMFAPKFGAYYKESLQVRTATGAALVENTDYVTTYYYPELWELNAKAVCAIIVITNPNVSNNVRITYQAVGGPYSLNVEEIAAILEEVDSTPATIAWEDIIDKPLQYNPAPHTHEYWQLYGLESTVINLELLGDAWARGRKGILDDNRFFYQGYIDLAQKAIDDYVARIMAHINDKSNPHLTDKIKVGLSEINNWGMAVPAQSATKTVNDAYQPMGGIYDQLVANIFPVFDDHLANTNNPHRVLLTDPLLNLYSTAQINALFAQHLARTQVAANSLALSGIPSGQVWDNIRTGLTTANVQPDSVFTQDKMGAVPGNPNLYALVGDQTYRSFESLMVLRNSTVQEIYFIGAAPLTDYNYLQVGTYVIRGEMMDYNGGRYSMNLTAYQKASATTWSQIL